MQLTSEQQAAINAFATGDNIRLIAYAGAAKTTTLQAMARSAPDRMGMYLAFNKAIAAESAVKFTGTNVLCRTAHSLAYRWAAGQGYTTVKLTGRLDMRSVADVPVRAALRARPKQALRIALATLRKWMQSDDPAPDASHTPSHAPACPECGDTGRADDLICSVCTGFGSRPHYATLAQIIWEMACSPGSSVPLGHDGYLKLWALQKPELPVNTIFVDEAQDLNPVLIGVLRNAVGRRQIISAGDPHQSIYGWRGAIDALQILPGAEMRLTQSFRFGGQIAETADRLLIAMGETMPLRGNGRPGYVGEPDDSAPDAILCRTNAGVFTAASTRPGCAIAGGTGELSRLLDDIERLQVGREALGVELAPFGSWKEVVQAADQEDDFDLAPLVRLVEREGTAHLRRILAQIDDSGSPVIGTAHRTKGLEWPHVEIWADFMQEKPSIEERRLFYVAFTRARFEVSVSSEVMDAYLCCE